MPPKTYLETVQLKRLANGDERRQTELLAALEAVKQAVETGSAQTVIKSDNTAILSALAKLEAAFKSVSYPDVSPELQAIKSAIENVEHETVDLSAVVDAIKAIELTPNVEVDFGPLQDTIKEHFPAPETEDKRLDLSCYRAQDITEDENKQYVGFLNTQGDWYIVENDIKGNSMRYVFGTGSYAKAFKKAASYQYKLLNEAVDALHA
jgi:hypothetical protein